MIDSNFIEYSKLEPLNVSRETYPELEVFRSLILEKNKDIIFFTYSTIDNYFNHHFYNVWDEKVSYFNTYPRGEVYSWYKGNIFPHDMEERKIRPDSRICLFNNSTKETYEDMFQIEELKKLW